MLLKVGAPFIAMRAKNFTSIPFVKVLSIQEVISGKKYKAWQDEANSVFWLVTRVGKMNPFWPCDKFIFIYLLDLRFFSSLRV